MDQLKVSPSAMAQFELDIGSDIPVPLDKPTGYGLPYPVAKSYVNETISNVKETIEIIKKNKDNFDNSLILFRLKVKYGQEQFKVQNTLIWLNFLHLL